MKFGDSQWCLARSEKSCGIVGKELEHGDATVHMRGDRKKQESHQSSRLRHVPTARGSCIMMGRTRCRMLCAKAFRKRARSCQCSCSYNDHDIIHPTPGRMTTGGAHIPSHLPCNSTRRVPHQLTIITPFRSCCPILAAFLLSPPCRLRPSQLFSWRRHRLAPRSMLLRE